MVSRRLRHEFQIFRHEAIGCNIYSHAAIKWVITRIMTIMRARRDIDAMPPASLSPNALPHFLDIFMPAIFASRLILRATLRADFDYYILYNAHKGHASN